MVKEYSKETGGKTRVSANFTVKEVACKGKGCCSKVKVDTDLVDILQRVRDEFGKAVTITSGYRCKTHNKAVGGASNSYHTKGMAADIVVAGTSPSEVAKYAESIGVKGIGCYTGSDGNFVHLDSRTKKAFWYGHAQRPCATFGGVSPVMTWQQSAIADGYKFKSGADGLWGFECEQVATKAICKKQSVGYKNKNLTKVVQNAIGVPVDGKYGKATAEAVKEYQKKKGLSVDGIVGHDTWKKILGV